MRILITGGTGSLGSALVERLHRKHLITVLSRDPHKQAAMQHKYPAVSFVLSDICNVPEVYKACDNQDLLLHTAAVKQVDTGEYHPAEFARVNITGSQIIANAWASKPGRNRHALLISTDKAVMPLNTYGATKRVAEAIFRKHDFSVIRYGNVVDSCGSFLHIWKERAAQGKRLPVRKPYTTRFILTIKHAVDLIEEAVEVSRTMDGIFVPLNLKSIRIKDVAASFKAETYDVPILPYEKVDEVLVADGERVMAVSDTLGMILWGWKPRHAQFNSRTAPRLSPEELFEILDQKFV